MPVLTILSTAPSSNREVAWIPCFPQYLLTLLLLNPRVTEGYIRLSASLTPEWVIFCSTTILRIAVSPPGTDSKAVNILSQRKCSACVFYSTCIQSTRLCPGARAAMQLLARLHSASDGWRKKIVTVRNEYEWRHGRS